MTCVAFKINSKLQSAKNKVKEKESKELNKI